MRWRVFWFVCLIVLTFVNWDDVTSLAAAPARNRTASVGGWAQLSAMNAGPAARYDHSAIVDPVRQQLVVFGGRGGSVFGDTWIFDFATRLWREVTGAGPNARFGHGAVYDAAQRRMIIVMGRNGGFFNDVWAFDLDAETWSPLKANGVSPDAPRPRYGQSAALDGQGRVLISHGFSDLGRYDDTWAFDPGSVQWINLTPTTGPKPLKRCLHELAYDAALNRLLLFGGCSSGYGPCPQGDLWAFDLQNNTWSELTPDGSTPSARTNPRMMYDTLNKNIFLFGGNTASGLNAETWRYEPTANRWTLLADGTGMSPSARSSHAGSYDAQGGRAVIFGGNATGGASADLWEWRLSAFMYLPLIVR